MYEPVLPWCDVRNKWCVRCVCITTQRNVLVLCASSDLDTWAILETLLLDDTVSKLRNYSIAPNSTKQVCKTDTLSRG